MSVSVWTPSAAASALHGDEIHVWRARLDLPDAQITAFDLTLSDDERQRADRFRMPRDRRHFVAARGILRVLLGQYLGLNSRDLSFLYGPQGKPSLPALPLHFNLSHSGDIALVAFRQSDAIGVDIEQIRRDFAWQSIAQRFYCAAEIAWLHSLPAEAQHDGFFRLWTRKEAFLKAEGEGIWHDLSRFDVSVSPVQESGRPLAWRLLDLAPGGDCKAALAVRNSIPTIQTREWRPL